MLAQSLISLVVVGLLGGVGILVGEYFRRKRVIKNEDARKIVHVLHAIALVVWAYFLPNYWPIIGIELLGIALVLLEKKYNILPGMRAVGRLSYGEVLFLVGVIILCLFNPSYSHFVIVVLHLGLADAAAAVVGKRVKSPTYKIRGHTKSVAGSVACYTVSLGIFVSYLVYTGQLSLSNLGMVVLAAAFVTLVENISPLGSDNLTIPLATYAFIVFANI
jgi:phytol kinase